MTDISAEEVENMLKELQEWIRYQPELPQNFGMEINKKLSCNFIITILAENLLLLRFLKVARWRVEKAQRLVKYSVELRHENPHIFSNRDPVSSEIQNVFNTM